MRNRPIYDVVALLARCGVGLVFLVHGWQKIQVGVNTTGRTLDAMGAPVPTAAAVYATFVELLGGAALILGLALPVAGTLLFLDMAGALIFVHAKHGILLVDKGSVHNGFELVLVLGLAALVFAASGGGRLSLDHRLFGQKKAEKSAGNSTEPVALGRGRITPDEHTAASPRRSMFPSRKRAADSDRSVPAGEFPAPPDNAETSSARPRLAAEMVTDTSRDVIVAGKKKTEPSSDDTTPVRTRKKSPKSDS